METEPKLKLEERFPIAILGIPIDPCTADEATQKALKIMEWGREKKHSFYTGTVNVDFLVNAHSWGWGTIRHPELVMALRNSPFNTADGMPIVWLSRFLGCPLPERVTGADFIPHLIETCSQCNKSVFLLGGEKGIAQQAAEILKNRYPNLRILGTASPAIHVTGEALEYADEEDHHIVNTLNHASPDLLIVALGNPKQEVWFQRICHRLNVPLTIGGGGTIDFMAQKTKRAPSWMQKWGLEWIHRLFSDPKRLWKRYLMDLFKFAWLTLPLITYHAYLKCKVSFSNKKIKSPPLMHTLMFDSIHGLIAVLALPPIFDSKSCPEIDHALNQTVAYNTIILDFQAVKFIDAAALGILLYKWTELLKLRHQVYGMGISSSIRRLMHWHRIWDAFQPYLCTTPEDLIERLHIETHPQELPISIEQTPDTLIVSFFGHIDSSQDHYITFHQITEALGGRHCQIHLNYCSFIDSSGIGFLLKLRRHQLGIDRRLTLLGVSHKLRQILHIAKVDALFQMQ